MSRFLARYSLTNDSLAEVRRAHEAEWRAMHRRPDTRPRDRAVTLSATPARYPLVALVRRVAGLRPGSQGVAARSRHRL